MSQTVIIVTNEGVRALLDVNSVPDYTSFHRYVIGKWSELAASIFSFSFIVGKHSNCVVGDEVEYANVLMLSGYVGEKFIEAVIIKESNVSSRSQVIVNESHLLHTPTGHDKCILMLKSPNNSTINVTNSFYTKPLNTQDLGQTSTEHGEHPLMRPVFEMCPNLDKVPLLSDDWKYAIKGVGQIFRGGRKEFRDELIKYATKSGFQYTFDKNNKEYIYVVCAEKPNLDCGWFIKGKQHVATGFFEIRKCNMIHGCAGTIQSNKTKRLGPKIISNLVMENVCSRPTHPGTDMKDHLKLAYGIDVPYYKAWRQ